MKRVLIVDDAAFIRMMVSRLLIQHGYEVVGEADNGQLALEMYKSLKPDLVTMDITMPIMTGLETLKEIVEFDSEARVVMLTAMGQQDMIMEAIQLGAKSFIVKPFKEEVFINTIRHILQ